MISKRTLIKWRREALAHKRIPSINLTEFESAEYIKRVLNLTQVLIDQHLLKEEYKVKEANLPY